MHTEARVQQGTDEDTGPGSKGACISLRVTFAMSMLVARENRWGQWACECWSMQKPEGLVAMLSQVPSRGLVCIGDVNSDSCRCQVCSGHGVQVHAETRWGSDHVITKSRGCQWACECRCMQGTDRAVGL